MKKLKKLVVLFTAALFCLLPVLSQPLTVHASEPVTYYVKYVDSAKDWRFQIGTSWDDAGFHRELYYMQINIKDGDIIVVDGAENLNLSVSVSLSNLTILKCPLAVIAANSIDEAHIVNGVTTSITGDVKNAYVYETSVANFNNNVGNLYIYDPTDPDARVACLGTVDYVKAYDDDYVWYEYYNFAAGSLMIDHGNMNTDPSQYSTTAPAAATTPAAPTTTTTTTTATTPSAGELDDVPKTGDFAVSPLWFLGIAVVCMLGHYKLEKR